MFIFATLLACVAHPRYVAADAICYNVSQPTPIPTTGKLALGTCTTPGALNVNVVGGGGGSTPIPYPTGTGGVLLVQPTNAPTFGVTVQNTPTVIIANPTAFPTPIPNSAATPFFVTCVVVSPGICPTPPASQAVTGTFWQSTQPVSVASTISVSPTNSNTCQTGTLQSLASNNIGSNTTLISHISTNTIHICGIAIDNTVSATVVQFVYGTGAACVATATGVFPGVTGFTGTFQVGFSGYPIVVTIPINNDFCAYVSGAAANANIGVLYTIP